MKWQDIDPDAGGWPQVVKNKMRDRIFVALVQSDVVDVNMPIGKLSKLADDIANAAFDEAIEWKDYIY